MNVESKVQLNKEVQKIKYDEKILITCADGSTYTADHVIITVSLGVLKANYQSLFDPPLPEKKVKIIQNYAFGATGKIFLEFSEPFWSSSNDFFSYLFLWREEDKQEVKLLNKSWLLDLITFFKVDSFPNLLQGSVAGEDIREFETISDEKMLDDIMWMLERFLNRKLKRASKLIRTRWLTNKNFLGSYSYLGMGLQKNRLAPKDLAEPLRKRDGTPFIHFAGEATDIEYPSYVHGAIESGFRAAEEIIQK